MDIGKTILKEIFGEIIFTAKEIKDFELMFERVEVNKGDILLSVNDTVYYQYFVSSGCLRTYFTEKSGKQHTIQFAIEDWWISDFTAFFSTSKAIMSIECIQDSVLYRVSKDSMEYLYDKKPALERLSRKKLESSLASFHKRTLYNLSLTAKERYLSFLKRYPKIEKSVKNYHIASYLGITTESLSRIRKEISDQ